MSAPAAQQPSAPDDELTLRVIVLGTADEARRIVDELHSGGNFVLLARQHSLDPSASNGGLLGPMRLSALRPELRDALNGLGIGDISPVVRIPTGFAILRVEANAEGGGSPRAVNAGLAATGSVRYVADIAGFGEASVIFQQADKPEGWQQDLTAMCRVSRQSIAETQRSFEDDLLAGRFEASDFPHDLVQAHVVLGQLHAYSGRMGPAIESLTKAYDLAGVRMPEGRPNLEELLAVAHLHKGALDGRHFHAPGDRCLLSAPPSPTSANADLQTAAARFERYLRERPDDLEVRWLLNMTHMMAGTYPDKVPARHLIPRDRFDSGEDIGRFTDVAALVGLASFASAGGVIVDDFDNDGRFEVVTSSFDSCEPLHFFRRSPTGGFANEAAKAGLQGQLGGLNIVQADYDNDGWLDILVLRGGWETPQRKSLLRNNGNGTFTDVTVAAGLSEPTATQAAVWTDVNRDGRLDLFVGNEESAAQLFVQTSRGTFEDVAAQAGVDRQAFSKGVAAGDYDSDGWPDLFVSNLGGRNFLYRNNRNGTFSEVAAAAGVAGPQNGFATWFFDYDNDGWQDLFVTSYFTSVEETARTYLGLSHNANTLKLYRNAGDGTFQDVTRRVALDKVFMPMGANFGDIDNDGFLDIYLGTGNPSYASVLPSVLLRNKQGQSYVDVTVPSGTGELHKGHGVAFADLDSDGDDEIVFEVGGATPGDAHALRLFENPGHGNDWLTVKLVGDQTNRSAIGARISVTVEAPDGSRRAIHRVVSSGGSFGASPLRQHIGLGRAARIRGLEIWWPVSNSRQRFTDVAPNQIIEIRESSKSYIELAQPRQPLRKTKGV
jgi:hypothetical protein